MDIRVAITKAAAYGIVAIVLVATFVGLNSFDLPVWAAMGANSALALFWAFAAHRMRTFIQTPLEEKWITDYYDSDLLINKLVSSLAAAFERQEVFRLIAEGLKGAIKIKKTSFLLAEKDHAPEPVKYVLAGAGEEEKIELPAGHPLVALFKEKKDLLQFAGLPAQLKTSLKEFAGLRNSVLIPIFSSEALEGIIILGPKVSEDPYNEKDLTLFRTIISQTLVVLDRVRPYEKIRADLEKAERELSRSQRLASLGTLTAGVTHEIRNPLAVIRSETERLTKKERTPQEMAEYQEMMMKHIDRIGGIVDRMLDMAKQKTPERDKEVRIDQVIKSILPFFKLGQIELVQELRQMPPIKGNDGELQEVFVNLIQNAIDAMPGGGKLTVKTYLNKEGHVVAEIVDTGKGIASDMHEKIFDPFYSSRHEGVGLGLSIVYRIIREHGGDVQVESEEGRGAAFRVIF